MNFAKEASRLGNTCFILLFWGTMALTLLALALSKRYPEVVAYGYPTALLLSTLSSSMYMTSKMRHSQVDSLDVEELTTKEQKQLKGASIKFALYFTAVMYIWTVVLVPGWRGSTLSTTYLTSENSLQPV